MINVESIFRYAPPPRDGDPGITRDKPNPPGVFRQSPGQQSPYRSTSRSTFPSFDRLLRPTWAEVDEAREQYEKDARRLRYWQRWFLGMFAVYTTLVGTLLLTLVVSN